MIHVDRKAVPAPASLSSVRAENAFDEAARYFRPIDTNAPVSQSRFTFDRGVTSAPDVRQALDQLFNGKCAFCESALMPEPGYLHHFRPRQEAVASDGSVSVPHYWWLAYTWENLYLLCAYCNNSAGARFPVGGSGPGQRARPESYGRALRTEDRLLIDPCVDDPSKDLSFLDSGHALGRSQRGTTTIEIFSLNREQLVEQRRRAIAVALEERQRNTLSLPPDRPYLGAIRQAVARRSGFGPSTSEQDAAAEPLPRRRNTHGSSVARLQIANFKGIESLDLRFAVGEGGEGNRWTLLLGENGFGKSSVLQAIALCLMGAKERERLKLDYASLIREGADTAQLSLTMHGALDAIELTITPKGIPKQKGIADHVSAVAAYGASRLPGTAVDVQDDETWANRPRVGNLFDPRTELVPATRWLLAISEEDFTVAARALRDLTLQLEDTVLERRDGAVYFQPKVGLPIRLETLSDGYRSVIALAVDMMRFFETRFGTMDAAEGIVLIDEISVHLHPTWQMKVVHAFRHAFPRLQFIATTHDPLCLRGLDDGTVIALRRTRDGLIFALPADEVPPTRGLRVDQLLTSEIFGLRSTVDIETEELFNNYYGLLASHDRDEARIKALRDQLDDLRQLGATPRERLVLEAADDGLAELENVPEAASRVVLSHALRVRLRELWRAEGGPAESDPSEGR